MTASYGCFAWQNSEEQPGKRDHPAVFQSAEPSAVEDFRGGRDVDGLIIRCKKQQKQPDSPRGGEAQPSPPRKRGPRACPWLEQGTTGGGVALDSRLRGNDDSISADRALGAPMTQRAAAPSRQMVSNG